MTTPPSPGLLRQDSEVALELKVALEEACLEAGITLSSDHFSPKSGFWLWEEPDAAPVGKVAGWFAAARKRSIWSLARQEKKKPLESISSQDLTSSSTSSDLEDLNQLSTVPSTTTEEQPLSETTLKERLGKAKELDIRSGKFAWDTLLTVCRTEHMKNSGDNDEKSGSLMEVTVNSGGVVYYSLFRSEESEGGEAAACIKFAPSRLATQSELLGLELARHLGVLTPQARVIHNGSSEWSEIIAAVEKAKDNEKSADNEVGENTCGELLEALSINRSLLLMGYIDGGPLLESSEAFDGQTTAERTAETLGRVLVLDLVLRNEDRLVCELLGWRGNCGNLMATKKQLLGTPPQKERDSKSFTARSRARTADRKQWGFRKQLKSQFDHTFGRGSLAPDPAESSIDPEGISKDNGTGKSEQDGLWIVAIDSGVPRRPPSSKAEKDKAQFPKFVELLLNDEGTAAKVLQEISGNNLGCHSTTDTESDAGLTVGGLDQHKVVRAFQDGFRAGAYDMQDLRMFLLKLFRKFNQLLKEFVTYMASVEDEKPKEESPPSNRASRRSSLNSNSPNDKLEDLSLDPGTQSRETEGSRKSTSGRISRTPPQHHDSPDQSDSSVSRTTRKPTSRVTDESWNGKLAEGKSKSPQLSSRLTLKLKDVNRSAKMDSELSKELDWWDERIRVEGQKICQEQDFTTGFLDHSSSHSLVDSYELKVRLDHLLERMALIVQGVQTERPSSILKFLFVGGVLAARSVHTLQIIGITDVLCLCPNELTIENDCPDSFEFKSFQVKDVEDENIDHYFEEASAYIDSVEEKGGAILVHCFEGKSRSVAVILGYLMLRKGQTLFQAWGLVKAAHPRAQPNDGFMKILVDLDKQLHGKVSMDWKQKKPEIRMCPVCGRSAGISNTSLRQHLRRAHPDVTQVPLTTSKSPEAHQLETATAPLDTLLSAVGV